MCQADLYCCMVSSSCHGHPKLVCNCMVQDMVLTAGVVTGGCLSCVTHPPVVAVGSFVWSRLLKPIQRGSAFFADVALGLKSQAEQQQALPYSAPLDALGGPTLAEVMRLELDRPYMICCRTSRLEAA